MERREISRKNFIRIAGLAGALMGLGSLGTSKAENRTGIPQKKGLRFLFQGDSITDGNRGRNEDPNHIMGHGYAFSIASRIGADFPEAGFTFFNRGISGNTVPDLLARWQTDTLDLKPDVLSLLVGINDVGSIVENRRQKTTLTDFENGYRGLLESSVSRNPELLIVLGLPFVFPVGRRKENWDRWQNETLARAGIVKKLAQDFNAVLVDFLAVFEKAAESAPIEYWIWDGVHPTVFGHELMAREWIKQAATRMDFLQHYKYD